MATTLRERANLLLEGMGIEKTATILTDVKAIASKLGVDYTALGPTLAACEAKRAREPQSKRKAAVVDLTQSDDEPKPKCARVEPTSAAAPAATKPWETPEWKAHCAAKKEGSSRMAGILAKRYSARHPGLFESLHNVSDEEEWRNIHDPVGAKRLYLHRIFAKKDMGRLDKNQYIEQQVREFARKLDGPCQCRYAGPGECESRVARHECICKQHEDSYERSKCKSEKHDCICRQYTDWYERSKCKSEKHDCICRQYTDWYERSKCKSEKHDCICRQYTDWYERSKCKSKKHLCICRQYTDSYERSKCQAAKHLV
jgi:hypothetical protein